MAPNCSGGIRNSSTSAKSRHALKKGPWTASEDMLLVEYVKKHGEGNWNAVQRNSGLMRCGKSCRLRWANHLRPNLKKGAFSQEEERLIVELHAKLGNKWARMAAQMPGRTDNEIKNYWNTRLKRRQRAGLPIYPHEIRQEQHLIVNSSPSSFSSLLASSHPPNPNPFCFFNPPSNIEPQQNHLHANNGGLALSLAAAANSSYSSTPLLKTPFLNQVPSNSLPVPSMIQYNSLNFGINSCPGEGVLGLPSIQSVTPAASSSDQFVMATSSDDAEEYEVDPGFSRCNKSGLLEDLLGESQAFAGVVIPEDSSIAAAGNVHEKADFSFCHGSATSENYYEGQVQKTGDSINTVDDDLLNLLDNFPLAVPIPEWNEGSGYESSNFANGTNATMGSQPDGSQYNPIPTSTRVANQEWNFGSFLWNNMPTIS